MAKRISSETADTDTEDGSVLPAVTVSPVVEFLLLFGLTLAGALSLVLLF